MHDARDGCFRFQLESEPTMNRTASLVTMLLLLGAAFLAPSITLPASQPTETQQSPRVNPPTLLPFASESEAFVAAFNSADAKSRRSVVD